MKMRIMLLMLAGLFAAAAAAGAREVRLQAGETYQEDDLTVTCQAAGGPRQATAPMSLRECQHWDDFKKKCLFEKNILTYGNLECVEECQHWDAFHKTCNYQTRCAFYPDHESFVRTTCDDFDDFKGKCLRAREEKIGPSGRGRR